MPRSSSSIRLLLLGDSHLGFDQPLRPRVKRRRRGPDFLANYERALLPARDGEVDLVVHGGDLFHQARVPISLAYQAFRPLLAIAEAGTPVFLVPGNHERSRIPHDRLAAHPNLHIFRRPGTRTVQVKGVRVSVSGFPYHRPSIRQAFPEVLGATGWDASVPNPDGPIGRSSAAGPGSPPALSGSAPASPSLRFLCMHHCVEGAKVGPSEFTFRNAPDVIRGAHLPTAFSAVLSGHIHRHQILQRDLSGTRLPAPVAYPGSVERTAFAERDENKGYLLLDAVPGPDGGTVTRYEFVPLPARPMVLRDLQPAGGPSATWKVRELERQIDDILAVVPTDGVIRLRIHGRVGEQIRQRLGASRIRRISPPEMNLQVMYQEDRRNPFRRPVSGAPAGQDGGGPEAWGAPRGTAHPGRQLDLDLENGSESRL